MHTLRCVAAHAHALQSSAPAKGKLTYEDSPPPDDDNKAAATSGGKGVKVEVNKQVAAGGEAPAWDANGAKVKRHACGRACE